MAASCLTSQMPGSCSSRAAPARAVQPCWTLAYIVQMTHGSESDIQIWWTPRLKTSHEGTARLRHFQPRVIMFECRTNDRVSSVLLWPTTNVKYDFYRAMPCIRGTSHGPVSVHLSVTSRCSTKTAKYGITQTTPHDSPGTLVFWSRRSPRNSTGVTPYGGAKCRWGGKNRRLSTNNRLYLENGTR